ncbi:MAG: HEPN domain-containing protein [bacterium]|nr:HEPN domain-containing protein [bacterium]
MHQDSLNPTDWILKAQNDLKSAEILFQENGPTDSICFHCHQSVEKMLKAFLLYSQNEYPKVHDLIFLLNLGIKTDKSLEELKEEISFLNRFHIETRYPLDLINYSREECREAVEKSQKITQFIVNKIVK